MRFSLQEMISSKLSCARMFVAFFVVYQVTSTVHLMKMKKNETPKMRMVRRRERVDADITADADTPLILRRVRL